MKSNEPPKDGTDDPSIIQIEGFNGEVKCWRKLSARLKEFWKRYPPEAGYGLRSDTKDFLSTRPAMASCYEQIIQTGKDPEEFGLPKLGETGGLVLFRASLTLKGEVVAEATTLRKVSKTATRDWEKGETAAVNRLFAKLGLAGEVLDLDELEDIADATKGAGSKKGQASDAEQSAEDTKPPRGGRRRRSTGPKSGADTEAKAAAGERKLKALNRQISTMEKNKGIEASEPAKTVEEATARIRKLSTM